MIGLNKDMSYSNICAFYKSLYKTETNFWNDFNSYLKFQTEITTSNQISKGKENIMKFEEFTNKLSKIFSNGNHYKVYSRCTPVIFFLFK